MRAIILVLSLCLAACSSDPGFQALNLPTSGETLARGRSLFHGLAACGFCHGATSSPDALPSGGRPFYDTYGEALASNITPSKSGVAGWEVKDFVTALREGAAKDGRKLSAKAHEGMQWISDQDLLALVAYLRTAPPVDNDVPKREVDFIQRNTTGLFEGERTVKGFVPAIDPRKELEYGRYLVDHVARCGACHSSDGGVFNGVGYLEGGNTVKRESKEKIAPGITNSTTYGIGEWSEAQVVQYLQSGVSPDGKRADSEFCPINFYRLADQRDLAAIAKYLRSDTEAR